MRSGLTVLVVALVTSSAAFAGQFYGDFGLEPNPLDPSGKTKILHSDFGFEDANGLRWQTNSGDVTDGASIPPLFQPIIGAPFDDAFIRGAVIHDRYCHKDHQVRPWRDTHRVFYDALLTSGVPKLKAKIMYYAVYTFGPRWDKLSKGIPCGPNCINALPDYNEFHRDATYGDPDAAVELEAAAAEIKAMEEAEGITLDQIETMSDAKHSEDIFLKYSITR